MQSWAFGDAAAAPRPHRGRALAGAAGAPLGSDAGPQGC
jgi:hypothetical protein